MRNAQRPVLTGQEMGQEMGAGDEAVSGSKPVGSETLPRSGPSRRSDHEALSSMSRQRAWSAASDVEMSGASMTGEKPGGMVESIVVVDACGVGAAIRMLPDGLALLAGSRAHSIT